MSAFARIAAAVAVTWVGASGADAQDVFRELVTAEPTPGPVLAPGPSGSPSAGESAADGLRRPVGELTVTAPIERDLAESLDRLPEGLAIADPAARRFASAGARLVNADPASPRFVAAPVHWAAPATLSNPLWFEQANVERYGHHRGLCRGDVLTSSAISAAHFFADAATLPWKAFASPASDCDYTLGSYRPGSCNPHPWLRCERPVLGASGEALAVAGLILLVP
ncbi:MAG: hypothetical protein AAF805_08155 [Planctomycetota bacterium]